MLPHDTEVDVLDAAALSWQLAAKLLERGMPGDPAKAARSTSIAIGEPASPLAVTTTSGAATFPPPWSARGRASPLGGGRVYFELLFSSKQPDGAPAKGDVAMRYSGTWERMSPPPAISDSTSLTGWRLYTLGMVRRRTSRGELMDYGATPVSERFDTVGDLRRASAAGK